MAGRGGGAINGRRLPRRLPPPVSPQAIAATCVSRWSTENGIARPWSRTARRDAVRVLRAGGLASRLPILPCAHRLTSPMLCACVGYWLINHCTNED